jgi:hypothetical protein
MSSTSKIEGGRLDVVLQRLRDKPDSAPIADTEEFQALLLSSRDLPSPQDSMETALIDFIMPIIKEPGIFQEHNAIMLLEYLRDDVLPRLNETPELTRLATLVIDDEIARHTDMRDRRLAGVAA